MSRTVVENITDSFRANTTKMCLPGKIVDNWGYEPRTFVNGVDTAAEMLYNKLGMKDGC